MGFKDIRVTGEDQGETQGWVVPDVENLGDVLTFHRTRWLEIQVLRVRIDTRQVDGVLVP